MRKKGAALRAVQEENGVCARTRVRDRDLWDHSGG